jgi:hypothetical protein
MRRNDNKWLIAESRLLTAKKKGELWLIHWIQIY